jgi:surfeit locus 1 family protein
LLDTKMNTALIAATFRQHRLPSLIAIPGVLLLLALGSWQVSRHFERAAENELRDARLHEPPIAVDAALADPEASRFRRVAATGRFDHGHEIHVYARSLNGNEGYFILTPLLRQNLPPILINRGWVPTNLRDPERRAQGQVAGEVTIEGVLRTEARQAWLSPDNVPARNQWFWFDLPAMTEAAGIAGAPRAYIEAGAAPNPGGYPLGGQTQEQLIRPHLQYAATWYMLAVALAAIYVLYVRQSVPGKARGDHDRTAKREAGKPEAGERRG